MSDINEQSKRLKQELIDHQDEYISGQRDLNETLVETEKLYNAGVSLTETTASKMIPDSSLLELQTKIAKQCVKAYTVDTLVFNPKEFSIKVRNFFCPRILADEDNVPKRPEPIHKVWDKLGDYSKDFMYTVPNFSFLYGLFDAEKIEIRKKNRKQIVKDKIGEQTKPEKVNANQSSKQQDVMLASAETLLAVIKKLARKNKNTSICFYEFVTNPSSYTKTIENIFLVSLLVKEGHLSISLDEQQMPWLKYMHKSDKERWDTSKVQQTVVTLTMEEWQEIINTFKFETSVIPPRQSQAETEE